MAKRTKQPAHEVEAVLPLEPEALEVATPKDEPPTIEEELASLDDDLKASIATLIDSPISAMDPSSYSLIHGSMRDAARFLIARGLHLLPKRLQERMEELNAAIHAAESDRRHAAEAKKPRAWRVTKDSRFILPGQITELRAGSVCTELTHDIEALRKQNVPLEPFEPPDPRPRDPVLAQDREYMPAPRHDFSMVEKDGEEGWQ